jgi:hypothetical protein
MVEIKGINNCLKNTTHKNDDSATWTALKSGDTQE